MLNPRENETFIECTNYTKDNILVSNHYRVYSNDYNRIISNGENTTIHITLINGMGKAISIKNLYNTITNSNNTPNEISVYLNNEKVKEYKSIKEACIDLNLHYPVVIKCIKEKKPYKGYTFKNLN